MLAPAGAGSIGPVERLIELRQLPAVKHCPHTNCEQKREHDHDRDRAPTDRHREGDAQRVQGCDGEGCSDSAYPAGAGGRARPRPGAVNVGDV